jgi:hypothetical protein
MSRRTFTIIAAAVVLAALTGAAYVGLKFIPASIGYTVEAEFEEMPADDAALEAWLLTQPGVARAIVGEHTGQPNKLVVTLIMVRNTWGQPPFPNLESKCEELGYRGRKARFNDCFCLENGVRPRR